jgi:hypothetical protein
MNRRLPGLLALLFFAAPCFARQSAHEDFAVRFPCGDLDASIVAQSHDSLAGLRRHCLPAPTQIRPRQVVDCPSRPPGYVDQSKCAFPHDTLPNALLAFVVDGACADNTCNTVGDTQGNTFAEPVVVQNNNGTNLYYSLRTKGGPDEIVLLPRAGFRAVLLEYPPALSFEGGNSGTYSFENAALGARNGDSYDQGWTLPVEANSANDLVIAWGKSGGFPNEGGVPKPGPFFNIEANVDESLGVEDMTGGGAGVYIGTMGWNVPAHWTLGVALFKMVSSLSLAIQQCPMHYFTNNNDEYACSFSAENFEGDTLVFPVVGNIFSITDSNQNMWVQDLNNYAQSFWHASHVKAGANTVTVKMKSPGNLDGILLEYPPATSVQVSSLARGISTLASVPTISTSGPTIVIGFGVQWTSSLIGPSGFAPGFSSEYQVNEYAADEKLPEGGAVEFTTNYPSAVNWFAGVAILSGISESESFPPLIPVPQERSNLPLERKVPPKLDVPLNKRNRGVGSAK